ncbi:MAG: 3-hydroxyacyl-CoA dehydrogenase NAD-binding domain-containing protein [Deltaproteobacteria bacterium]
MGAGNIFQWKKQDDIGIVTIDIPGQPMNTWTQDAVEGFYSLLDDLEKATDTTGVVFVSGKTGNFHSGADLNLLGRMNDKEETSRALDSFHEAFTRLSTLSFPTLAAIEGHCLGGGLEFALSCTARIAKDSGNTMLGLPECTLGIFPGAGGTQRLPRLIGFPAIELILKGTIFPASKALELGVVDRLVRADGDLLNDAISFLKEIASNKEVLKREKHDFSAIDQIAEMARKEVLKVTRGREIPGLMLAVSSIQEGIKVPLEEGLIIEKNNFVEAVLSNEAKGSVHTFFLKTMSDKPRAMMSKGFQPKLIKKAAVLGFGTMGRGIVIDILSNMRIPVLVKDIPEAIEPGKAFVAKIMEGMAAKNRLKGTVDELVGLLTVTTGYDREFQDVDLVIEAVFEDIRVKEKVYKELCAVVADDCIIATNTSSIPLASMSEYVTLPERFGGLHFFSPVWIMQLVEVIKGEKTSQDTIDNLLNFAASTRKRPIVCKDNPGFVVNAVLFPYFMDSMKFIESGIPIEKTDDAFVKFGMPVGPIRLLDEVGIDVGYSVIKGRNLEQDTLKNVVAAGHLGLKKSGKGFFLKDGAVDPQVLPLISLKEKRNLSAEEMQLTVLTDMVTVGKELLDKAIVDDPRMIDIGMIWGTGFPAEKGGPLKWADLIGLSQRLFGKTFYQTP